MLPKTREKLHKSFARYRKVYAHAVPITRTARDLERTPRNADCPCGSGLKHKNCCLKNFR